MYAVVGNTRNTKNSSVRWRSYLTMEWIRKADMRRDHAFYWMSFGTFLVHWQISDSKNIIYFDGILCYTSLSNSSTINCKVEVYIGSVNFPFFVW